MQHRINQPSLELQTQQVYEFMEVVPISMPVFLVDFELKALFVVSIESEVVVVVVDDDECDLIGKWISEIFRSSGRMNCVKDLIGEEDISDSDVEVDDDVVVDDDVDVVHEGILPWIVENRLPWEW